MRKGTVFIFTGEYPSDFYLNYLARELPNLHRKVFSTQRRIDINGYDIKVMKYPDYKTRGYRPEFIYFIGNTVNYNGNIAECDRAKKQIEMDTKILSTRKESIRYINEAEEIDLREFIDDDYALLKCRFKKLRWKDKFKYVWFKIRNKLRKEN